MTTVNNTCYIDEIYAYDCVQRKGFGNEYEDGSFLTGSAAEGAFICRGVWETTTNIEMDVMKTFGVIPSDNQENILVPTDVIGYYHLKWNNDLMKCLDPMFADLLLGNGNNQEYVDSQILKLFCKMNGQGTYQDGTPNICTNMDNMVHIERDFILCIELAFWPQFLHPWFQRDRYWPSSEIIEEIDRNKCHLVMKSVPGSDRNDEWRISFSKAEVILSKGKSHFQNKCYLLAKFIYYANLKQFNDDETGRHISSYLLKTTMLHMLEQTPPEQWKYWEERQSYCHVVIMLYERLAESLSTGYLPSYFVEEINLLSGYSERYLMEMEVQILELCKMWSTTKGEEFFHSTIKTLFDNVKNKMETPEAKLKSISDFICNRAITPEQFLDRWSSFDEKIKTFANGSNLTAEGVHQMSKHVQQFGMSSMGFEELPEPVQKRIEDVGRDSLQGFLGIIKEMETKSHDPNQLVQTQIEQFRKMSSLLEREEDKEVVEFSTNLLEESLAANSPEQFQNLFGKLNSFNKTLEKKSAEEVEPPPLTEEAQQIVDQWKPVYEKITGRKYELEESSGDESDSLDLVNLQNVLSGFFHPQSMIGSPNINGNSLPDMLSMVSGNSSPNQNGPFPGCQHAVPAIHQPHIPMSGYQNSIMTPSAGQWEGQNHSGYHLPPTIHYQHSYPRQTFFQAPPASYLTTQSPNFSTLNERTNHFHKEVRSPQRHSNKRCCTII